MPLTSVFSYCLLTSKNNSQDVCQHVNVPMPCDYTFYSLRRLCLILEMYFKQHPARQHHSAQPSTCIHSSIPSSPCLYDSNPESFHPAILSVYTTVSLTASCTAFLTPSLSNVNIAFTVNPFGINRLFFNSLGSFPSPINVAYPLKH